MKFKYIKSIVSAALFLSLTTGMTSCINDLDISPIDPLVICCCKDYVMEKAYPLTYFATK